MPKPRRPKQKWSSRFYTRTQSVKKLQLPLKNFRQMCIYKGIHPRVPKKIGGDSRVFYHKKDIKFLAHEPSIEVLREQRRFYRKIRAARQRKDKAEAARLEMKFPKMTLSHILKERYPTFQHALRDLDDPLTMAHLYANLHQQSQHRNAPDIHEAAARLCAEFQAYVIKTHSLRKMFVSVKGYYYQAEVMGIPVTWSVPHKFVQNFNTRQIDPFVMMCYMEFYKVMLGFVNFRLFHSIRMTYPPKLNSDQLNATLPLEGLLQDTEDQPSTEVALEESEDEMEEIGEKAAGKTANVSAKDDAALCAKLFGGLVFLLGRETPSEQLIFVIRAFGGVAVREDEAEAVKDDRVTHCVCDRELVKESMKAPRREYVQPQWIFDSCNARVLLPTESYGIGRVAPPHLSPFVSAEDEGYVPDYAKEIRKIQEAANLLREENDTSAQEAAIKNVLEDDVALQEEKEAEKVALAEAEYIRELEIEMETEFPIEVSGRVERGERNSVTGYESSRVEKRGEEAVKEKERMEEIMISKQHQYKKLKRKEVSKQKRVEKLKKRKSAL